MPKLSKEAWTAAFFAVMKEPMPVGKSELRRVGAELDRRKGGAEKGVKDARGEAERARAIADDLERKRYAAGVALDESHSKTLTEEGRGTARREYDEAAQRAREAADMARQARLALKERSFELEQLRKQMADVAQRAESGNVDGLGPELAQAIKHAQLEKRLEFEKSIVVDLEERKRLREDELQAARRNYRQGEALILEGDVQAFQEKLEASRARCDAIEALLPGFSLEPPEPSQAEKLAEAVQRMRGAAKASDDALHAESTRREERETEAAGKRGELEAAAVRDPSLKKAAELLAQKRAALAEAQERLGTDKRDVEAAAAALREAQNGLDAYASDAKDAPSARDVDSLMMVMSSRAQTLAARRDDVRKTQETLRLAVAEVQGAKQALDEAIAARVREPAAPPGLVAAREAVQAAEAEVRRAQAAEAEARDAAGRVHQLAEEAERRRTHAQALPEATAAVAKFNMALKGIEDVPIWEGSSALFERLGEKRYNELRDLAIKLSGQYETLCKNGATMEELQALYKDTPDLWKPPRFREEEKNWVAMKDLVDEEAEDKYRKENESRLSAVDKKIEAFKGKLEKGETVAGLLVKGMELPEKVGDKAGKLVEEVGKALAEHKELAEKAEAVVGLAAKLASVFQAPVKAADAAMKSMASDDPVEVMMLQEEFMASLGELVGGLTGALKGAKDIGEKFDIGGALVKEISNLLPGIGVATNAAEAMKGLVESAERIEAAFADAEAHAEALQGGHRAETAIDQCARRDKHLAARAATRTGVAMIKTAAAAVDLSGVGLTAGAAMKGAATGVSTVQAVAEQVIDRTEGEKARELLQRAQAGDGHARSELFRYHPRYAKGILAIMASEGDALALRVLSTHGLDEASIRRSSPKIIKRYLMKKFGESDTPPSWTGIKESVESGLDTVASCLDRVGAFFGNVSDKLKARIAPDALDAVAAMLNDLRYQLASESDVATAVSSMVDIRLRRDALAKDAKPEQATDLAAVTEALDAELAKVAKVRQGVLASLEQVRQAIDKLSKIPASEQRDGALASAKSVLKGHLQRVGALATVS